MERSITTGAYGESSRQRAMSSAGRPTPRCSPTFMKSMAVSSSAAFAACSRSLSTTSRSVFSCLAVIGSGSSRCSIAPNADLTLEEAVSEADVLVEEAVARQLESDVPLGALLSGGIDSSLVSAAARRRSEETLHTFNVRFADVDYDETAAAQAV